YLLSCVNRSSFVDKTLGRDRLRYAMSILVRHLAQILRNYQLLDRNSAASHLWNMFSECVDNLGNKGLKLSLIICFLEDSKYLCLAFLNYLRSVVVSNIYSPNL